MAAEIQSGTGPWPAYLAGIAEAQDRGRGQVGVYPLLLDERAVEGTELGQMFNRIQRIGRGASDQNESRAERCRDLAQALVRLIGDLPGQRLKVFISYTNHAGPNERGDVTHLIRDVKAAIRDTKLHYFVDAEDLQPGEYWADDLRELSQTAAFLALRTDLYAASNWCQLEMRNAKCAGVPIVVLDALGQSEGRGSFLMDNVPRVPVRDVPGGWDLDDIRRGLNLLVDECLKNTLWLRQRYLVERENPDLVINWWSPHSPEPTTLLNVLCSELSGDDRQGQATPFRIVHPGPDLQDSERAVLDQLAAIAQTAPLDILTPTSLASRGGLADHSGALLPSDSLRGLNLGLSVSTSTDLMRLGLLEDHFKAALAELTTTVLKAQGNVVYSGGLRPEGYLRFVATQTEQSRHLERPFHVCLVWQEHRSLSLTELRAFAADLDNFATLACLDVDGRPVPLDHERGEAPSPVTDPAVRQRALTSMRLYMRERESARVFLAGSREGFQGVTAGLVEEAYLALSVQQPVFLAAGFGGVTADIAHALGYDTGQLALGLVERAREPRLREWLDRLTELTRRPDWAGLNNGLTPEENLELVGSRRPADIGALICLGLGRLGRRPTIDPWGRS